MNTTDRMTLAAIGDLHVTETASRPYSDLFKEMSDQADAIVLCGGSTKARLPASPELAHRDSPRVHDHRRSPSSRRNPFR